SWLGSDKELRLYCRQPKQTGQMPDREVMQETVCRDDINGRRHLLEELEHVCCNRLDIPMQCGKAVPYLSAHNVLLIDQLYCHVWPFRRQPLGNAQHECTVACAKVDQLARNEITAMLQQCARHNAVGHCKAVQAVEISSETAGPWIIARNVIRQLGVNNTQQVFLRSHRFVGAASLDPWVLRFQVFSLGR